MIPENSENIYTLPRTLSLDPVPKKRQELHGFFRFPGSFHPPLLKYLFSLNNESKIIGDPLCGSGSVALEGITNNKLCYNMDIDPISVLITHVKTNPIPVDVLEDIITQWTENIGPIPLPHMANKKMALSCLEELEHMTKYRRPYNVFHWFDPYIVVALSKYLMSIEETGFIFAHKLILEAVIATIIRRVSRADIQPVSGLEVTRIMQEKLNKGFAFNIRTEIDNRVNILKNGYSELFTCEELGKSITQRGDALKDWQIFCSSNMINPDIIVTSPPYCNAIEYWRRHRLELFWLGFLDKQGIIDLSRSYIGSTTVLKHDLEQLTDLKSGLSKNVVNKLFVKNKARKASLIKKYFLDCEIWMENIMDSLSKTGTVYIVVGPSTSYGINIDTPKILLDISKEYGYEAKIILHYSIKNQRMQYTTKNNIRIKTESVLELRK